MRLALDAKADDQKRWRLLQAWMTARLSMVDPKRFPSYESLLEAKTDAPADGVDHVLLARLEALSAHQRKSTTGEGDDGSG